MVNIFPIKVLMQLVIQLVITLVTVLVIVPGVKNAYWPSTYVLCKRHWHQRHKCLTNCQVTNSWFQKQGSSIESTVHSKMLCFKCSSRSYYMDYLLKSFGVLKLYTQVMILSKRLLGFVYKIIAC